MKKLLQTQDMNHWRIICIWRTTVSIVSSSRRITRYRKSVLSRSRSVELRTCNTTRKKTVLPAPRDGSCHCVGNAPQRKAGILLQQPGTDARIAVTARAAKRAVRQRMQNSRKRLFCVRPFGKSGNLENVISLQITASIFGSAVPFRLKVRLVC